LLSKEELEQRKAEGRPVVAPYAPNPLLLGLSPSRYEMHVVPLRFIFDAFVIRYALKVLKDIRSNDLEEALNLLPFNVAMNLFEHFADWMEQVTS
jgi:hypothetical protein